MPSPMDKMLGSKDVTAGDNRVKEVAGFDPDEPVYNPTFKRPRTAYVVQSTSPVVNTREAFAGQVYIKPETEGDKPLVYDGDKGVKGSVLNLTTARQYNTKYPENKSICWSPDGVTGRPTPLGLAAPYSIPEGQACNGCRFQRKDTAPGGATNDYCTNQRKLKLRVTDPEGEDFEAMFTFQKKAGPIADALRQVIIRHMDKDTREITPFPVTIKAVKATGAGGNYFIPKIEVD